MDGLSKAMNLRRLKAKPAMEQARQRIREREANTKYSRLHDALRGLSDEMTQTALRRWKDDP